MILSESYSEVKTGIFPWEFSRLDNFSEAFIERWELESANEKKGKTEF